MGENLGICYRVLVEAEIIPQAELLLVDGWLTEIKRIASELTTA
jgi:hypothetical protein